MSVNVGVMFDAQEGLNWERWGQFAEAIERDGYESLWTSDHLVSLVGFPERPRVDPWVALTWLATATERLRLGSMVSPITWRHPALLAMTAASVDVLSGGRIEVGIGAGWNEYEHESFGIALPPIGVRFTMLEESAEVIRLLWTEDNADFDGEYFSLKGAYGHPRPVQTPHPPLIIGGGGPKRTLPIVARYADEWNVYGMTPAAYRKKLGQLRDCCEQVGRPIAEIRMSVSGPVVIGATQAELQARIEHLSQVFPLPMAFPPELAPFTAANLRANGWFAGTPDQIVEQIQALEAEGAERVMIQYLDVEDHDSLELFSGEVLPNVQQ